MVDCIYTPSEKSLGEFINEHYPDFVVVNGDAPLDMDISHGIEFDYTGKSRDHNFEQVKVYPFVLWSDGIYKPCHYWGNEYFLTLEKR